MLDFTECVEVFNNYKGSEKKKTLVYNNKKFLVKFPDPIIEKNKNISYINNAFSEYVGSNIFRLVSFTTQNAILGKYIYNGKEKVVCGCEDFTDDNNVLYEFECLALSTNPDKKIGTELEDILEVVEECKIIDTIDTKEKFWDMFITDSLIGNTDRHNGNWGFILNNKTNDVKLAPIYDCGSCLNPMLEDKEMEKFIQSELKNLAINCYSCLKENGKKINYITYIKSRKNEECNNALCRMFEKIDMNKIQYYIEKIPYMPTVRKQFYINILRVRYGVLKEVYDKLLSKN